jgi:hypothetical protein
MPFSVQPIALNGQAVDVNAVMALVARPIPDFHHRGRGKLCQWQNLEYRDKV